MLLGLKLRTVVEGSGSIAALDAAGRLSPTTAPTFTIMALPGEECLAMSGAS